MSKLKGVVEFMVKKGQRPILGHSRFYADCLPKSGDESLQM
jgi:hypothetical protein